MSRLILIQISHPRRGFRGQAAMYLLAALLSLATYLPAAERAPSPGTATSPSFRHDVMAVLSKAGCNMGACHGNANGKGGLKLSLRGEDPAGDLVVLTREFYSRRVNVEHPEASLLLRKATLDIAHEGGRRFAPDSPEYATLRDWIAAGHPDDSAQLADLQEIRVLPSEAIISPGEPLALQVTAHFSDGSQRDVTREAVYEFSEPLGTISPAGVVLSEEPGQTSVLVRYLECQVPVPVAFVPARPDYAWSGPEPANYIDEHIFARLQELKIHPAATCTDQAFIRRAYLDTLGLLPTADEARQFAANPAPTKRAELIDELLARPEFADHWALKWADLLRVEEKTLDRKGVQAFHHWIRQQIAQDRPLNEFAYDILTASGSTYQHPPANFYRALRDPIERSETVAQVFLGIRLQCAKCHNHPFDRWTQDDYYGWASVFARVDYKIMDNKRRDTNDKHEFVGEQIVWHPNKGDVKDPRTNKAAAAKLLSTSASLPEYANRLEAVAAWLATDENPFFATVQVNRIWYHLLGRGVFDPIDDLRSTNPASHPELLDALRQDFVTSGFSLRHMIRTIMSSQTYQLSSQPTATSATTPASFAHAPVQRLSAEQLLDSLSQTLAVPLTFTGYPAGLRAGEIPGVEAINRRYKPQNAADRFLETFGKPPRLLSCECERREEATLGQAFQLVSGELISEMLGHKENRLAQLLEQHAEPATLVNELYWTILSRAPSDIEQTAAVNYLADSSEAPRAAVEDICWSLLSSTEFLLRY